METIRKILKTIFCPPLLWTILAAVFGFGLVLAVAIFHIEEPAVRYVSYFSSAYALVVTCAGLRYVKPAAGAVKSRVASHPLTEKLRSTKLGGKYLSDVRFRAGVSLWFGLFMNLLYIVLKLVSGILYRSAWFIALAVYYVLLAGMRLLLVRRLNTQDGAAELRRYRLCGIMLLFMNQALTGIVVFMVHQNKGFDYPGPLIYAMAFYAFYAVITAAVRIVRTRRYQSPILSATKAVDLVAALVSILSLTTAMLGRFGGDDDPAFRRTMTAAVGGGVCTAVILMAAYMIWRANKNLKKLQRNGDEA